ncbi:MAG: hypothetical protein MH186_02355 [Marinobacter sp.]|nr:hypothetical protein [Marinobacter sp.]
MVKTRHLAGRIGGRCGVLSQNFMLGITGDSRKRFIGPQYYTMLASVIIYAEVGLERGGSNAQLSFDEALSFGDISHYGQETTVLAFQVLLARLSLAS